VFRQLIAACRRSAAAIFRLPKDIRKSSPHVIGIIHNRARQTAVNTVVFKIGTAFRREEQ
jgi:hypothetical protein